MYESIISKNHRLKSCKSDLKNPKSERILWNCASWTPPAPLLVKAVGLEFPATRVSWHIGRAVMRRRPPKVNIPSSLTFRMFMDFSGLMNSYEFKEYCIKVRNYFLRGEGAWKMILQSLFFQFNHEPTVALCTPDEPRAARNASDAQKPRWWINMWLKDWCN